MRQCVFLAYSVGESSVSGFFSRLALKLSTNFAVIVFSDKRSPLPFSSENIFLLHWPSPRPTKFRDFLFLCSQIKKYKPIIMLSTFGANNMFLLAGFFRRVPHRIATHRTISSHFRSTPFKLFRKKMVFKLATRIIANSCATKSDVVATFGVSPKKVVVVYNAVENPNIQEIRDPNLIVFAGRLTTNKGIDILLDAFQIVAEKTPNLRLKILGGTRSEVTIYKNKIKDQGFGSRIVFLGSQPKNVVLSEFARARYVVVPSLSEGFGFVVIEAFSVKTPVIGSDTGGIKEIIRTGKDGLLFAPGDHKALAAMMLQLGSDDKMILKFGENAYQRYCNTFELDHVVDHLAMYLSAEINNYLECQK